MMDTKNKAIIGYYTAREKLARAVRNQRPFVSAREIMLEQIEER